MVPQTPQCSLVLLHHPSTYHRLFVLTSRGSSSDRDFSLIRPHLRIFTPDILSQEMELDWVLRPTISKFQDDIDSTLRTRSLLPLPSLTSVQTYLLGGYEGRVGNLPTPSSTITDFYLPDSDIHGSGLCCSSLDHRTALADEEFTVTSLHQKLSREDYLTDSESDDDEVYPDLKPTFSNVRDILHPLVKDVVQGGNENKPTKLVHQTQVLDSHDGESVLDLADRKFDQVELMRDRKTLEHATHLRQLRESKSNQLIHRYFISFTSFSIPSQASSPEPCISMSISDSPSPASIPPLLCRPPLHCGKQYGLIFYLRICCGA